MGLLDCAKFSMNKLKNFNQIAIAVILVVIIGNVVYQGVVNWFICPGDAEIAAAACEGSLVLGEPDRGACFCAKH